MKLSDRVAPPLLAVALLFGTVHAADALAAAPADEPAAAAAPAPDKARAVKHRKARVAHGAISYDACMKEKAPVVDYFCNAHSDGCADERMGAEHQCKSEARGERQSG